MVAQTAQSYISLTPSSPTAPTPVSTPSTPSTPPTTTTTTTTTTSPAAMPHTTNSAIDHCGMGLFQYRLILITGLCWTAESMEMLLLSFIKQPIQCAWGITDASAALVTTSVGVGMLTGSAFWGLFADSFGRRPAFILSTCFTALLGLASALSPSYHALLLTRGLVGFGIGGVPVAFSLLMEFLPSSHRGTWGMALSLFWSAGAVFEAVVAMLVLPRYGWRVLIVISSLPLFVVLLLTFFVPESPRWLVTHGAAAHAKRVLAQLAVTNRAPLDAHDVVVEQSAAVPPKTRELFRRPVLSLTMCIFALWFVSAFSYYGLVMLQPELIRRENAGLRCGYAHTECSRLSAQQTKCEQNPICAWNAQAAADAAQCVVAGAPGNTNTNNSTTSSTTAARYAPTNNALAIAPLSSVRNNADDIKRTACATELRRSDFVSTLFASLGEVPGVIVTFLLINRIGRRPVIGYMYFLTALCYLALLLCLGRGAETALFFLSRSASSAFQTVYVFTNELYPAAIRATAMGLSSSVARVGLILTPLVAQYLSNVNGALALATYAAVTMIAVLAVLLVQVETTNRPLLERMDQLVQLLNGHATPDDGGGDGDGDGDGGEVAQQRDTFANDRSVPRVWRWLRWRAKIDGVAHAHPNGMGKHAAHKHTEKDREDVFEDAFEVYGEEEEEDLRL